MARSFPVRLSNEELVESKPVEGLIFEVITVGLLRELSVSAHLKEIDLAGDCHKEFKRVHKHFLKRFAYLCR